MPHYRWVSPSEVQVDVHHVQERVPRCDSIAQYYVCSQNFKNGSQEGSALVHATCVWKGMRGEQTAMMNFTRTQYATSTWPTTLRGGIGHRVEVWRDAAGASLGTAAPDRGETAGQ